MGLSLALAKFSDRHLFETQEDLFPVKVCFVLLNGLSACFS